MMVSTITREKMAWLTHCSLDLPCEALASFLALNLISHRALFILGFIFLQETFAPTLLRRKAAKLQKAADAAGSGEHFIAKYDVHKKSTATVLKLGFAMPFQLLFGEIIVMALSLYSAYCVSVVLDPAHQA